MASIWPDIAARRVLDSILLDLESCLQIDSEVSILVESLYSSRHLNNHQKQNVYSGTSNLSRVGKLLDYLYGRGSTETFVAFVDILGSDEGENLPEMREELIRKYGAFGGNLNVFGADGTANIPSLSRPETNTEVPIKSLSWDGVVKKDFPAGIRDVIVSTRMQEPLIFLLLDGNRCSRMVWSPGDNVSEPVHKRCPRDDTKNTADNFLLLRPQRMALFWPRHIRYVDISFSQADQKMKFEEPVRHACNITCQAEIPSSDAFVIGDSNGKVILFNYNPSSQSFLDLQGNMPVAGVVVNGKNKLLAWTEDGHRTVAVVKDGRLENNQNSRTRSLLDGCKLRACAGDFNRQFAECIQLANGQIVLNTFEEGRQRLKQHDMGNDPNNCLQLVMDGDECAAATAERFVYVQKRVVICQFSLPWKDKDIEHLRVQRLGRSRFLLVATSGTECFLLSISQLVRR